MILIFDTETTGFAHKQKPRDHEDQPHVVELAAELCDYYGNTKALFHTIIDPGVCEGVRIPSKVVEIHGIDEERCWREGLNPLMALEVFDSMLRRADLVVAHNVDFDVEMMAIQYDRWNGDAVLWPRTFCTMKTARNVIGGSNPNLGACTQHFFNMEHARAHSALWDMRACKDIYFHLQALQKAEPAPKQEISTFPSIQPDHPNAIKGPVDIYPSNPPKSVWDPE